VQLDTLSVLRTDGSAFDAKVNGWAADDDGIQGLRGTYVWRADEVLALSSLTGALSGGADAMAQRQTTTQVPAARGHAGSRHGRSAQVRRIPVALVRLQPPERHGLAAP
jgi:hypothetical protein